MYYWGKLQKTDTKLEKQLSPVKNDWCLKIKEDLAYLDIDKDESEISAMTKLTFKQYLNIKIKDAAQKYLSSLKNKHTKSEGLRVTDQISSKLSLSEKQLMFQFRTPSYKCRANYKNQYGSNLACLICGEEDDHIHLLQCK